MAQRILLGLVGGALFYAVGFALGLWLIPRFTANTHDVAVEAAMTAAFITGPVGGLIGFFLGFLFLGGGRHR